MRFLLLFMLSFPLVTVAETYSTYEGKIVSLYSHERDSNPYFGIVLEGKMDNNPCGTNLSLFIKPPAEVSDMHLAMLLSAHASGREVIIRNSGSTDAQKCHSAYSTFNFVQIK